MWRKIKNSWTRRVLKVVLYSFIFRKKEERVKKRVVKERLMRRLSFKCKNGAFHSWRILTILESRMSESASNVAWKTLMFTFTVLESCRLGRLNNNEDKISSHMYTWVPINLLIFRKKPKATCVWSCVF